MHPLWVELLGFVAGVTGIFISFPQLVRVIRLKSDIGVSFWTWLIITWTNVAWIGYGIRFDSPSQVWTNGVAALITGPLVFLLMRHRIGAVRSVLLVLATWAFGFSSCFFLPEPAPSILLMFGLTSRAPQVAASFRSWKLGRATAVSNRSYLIAIIASVIWVVYGFLMNLWAIVSFSGTVAILSALVLMLEAGARRRALALADTLAP